VGTPRLVSSDAPAVDMTYKLRSRYTRVRLPVGGLQRALALFGGLERGPVPLMQAASHVAGVDIKRPANVVERKQPQELCPRYRSTLRPREIALVSFGGGIHGTATCVAKCTIQRGSNGYLELTIGSEEAIRTVYILKSCIRANSPF